MDNDRCLRHSLLTRMHGGSKGWVRQQGAAMFSPLLCTANDLLEQITQCLTPPQGQLLMGICGIARLALHCSKKTTQCDACCSEPQAWLSHTRP